MAAQATRVLPLPVGCATTPRRPNASNASGLAPDTAATRETDSAPHGSARRVPAYLRALLRAHLPARAVRSRCADTRWKPVRSSKHTISIALRHRHRRARYRDRMRFGLGSSVQRSTRRAKWICLDFRRAVAERCWRSPSGALAKWRSRPSSCGHRSHSSERIRGER